MFRFDNEDFVREVVTVIGDNVVDVKDQKKVFEGLIEYLIDDLGLDNLDTIVGENSVFDEVYRGWMNENRVFDDDLDERDELDYDYPDDE